MGIYSKLLLLSRIFSVTRICFPSTANPSYFGFASGYGDTYKEQGWGSIEGNQTRSYSGWSKVFAQFWVIRTLQDFVPSLVMGLECAKDCPWRCGQTLHGVMAFSCTNLRHVTPVGHRSGGWKLEWTDVKVPVTKRGNLWMPMKDGEANLQGREYHKGFQSPPCIKTSA